MTTSDDLDSLVEDMKAQSERLGKFFAAAINVALERDRLQSELSTMTARAEAAEQEKDRLKSFLSEGAYETVQSEQGWKKRALAAEAALEATRKEPTAEEVETAATAIRRRRFEPYAIEDEARSALTAFLAARGK